MNYGFLVTPVNGTLLSLHQMWFVTIANVPVLELDMTEPAIASFAAVRSIFGIERKPMNSTKSNQK